MKKAKIMLLAIAVVATVGTALAFKVNKFGSHTYCYLTTTTQPAVGACTNEISSALANDGTGTFYTIKPSGGCSTANCSSQGNDFTN